MSSMALAWRLARRELRGGLRGFGIFLACLTLGVAVIAGVSSISASVNARLHDGARALLGGDVDFMLAQRPASAAERDFLAAHGKVSAVTQLRAMAVTASGAKRSLVELKAVDDAYPLYGRVGLAPAQNLDAALAEHRGQWGAIAARSLLDRLGLKLGDMIRIGEGRFVLRAVIAQEPDDVTRLFAFGPQVMVAKGALKSTGLMAPGTLANYGYRVRLKADTDLPAFVAAAQQTFPQAGWRIRRFSNAAPNLQRLLNRVTVFLTLVGLTALLVGGIGVGNAVESYLGGKTGTIATLKCLGASSRLVFVTYLLQILVLSLAGIAAGLVLGVFASFALAPLLPTALPVAVKPGLYPAPLLLASAYGLLTTLAFAAWPVGTACEVRPAQLFRSLVAPERSRPGVLPALIVGLAGLALTLLAFVTASDHEVAFWFILGAAAELIVFRLAAMGLIRAARLAGRPQQPGLRLALANLCRPGAAIAGVVASLGLGLSVLVAVALVHGNLLLELSTNLPAHAPSFFFIDIQPDQIAAFDKLLADMDGVSNVQQVPGLRGRITALNGVPVARAAVGPDARWATSSDRGFTTSATLPRGSLLVAGQWWPKDYRGKPLVSFAADLARGMHLNIGDTITVNVLGRNVTATIANLREIDWTSLNINFAMVFSPGSLAGAPRSYIATARAAPGRATVLERTVTDTFPNVSAISVKDAIATIGNVIAAIAASIQAMAAVTLTAGVLVLEGAIAAGHRRRVYEAVMLKVVGATRRQIAGSFLLEYGMLGLGATLIAAIIGSLAAYFVLTHVMHAPWRFLAGEVAATAFLATGFTLLAGFAGTWRALGAKAAPYLRNE